MYKFRRELRDLMFVPRWSIIRQVKQQSVAEHVAMVAIYADQIADVIEYPHSRGRLLQYALWHDMAEVFTGDMPGPGKKYFVNVPKLRAYEQSELRERFGDDVAKTWAAGWEAPIIKCADVLDEMFYLASEIQMGNGTLNQHYEMITRRAIERWTELPCWRDNRQLSDPEARAELIACWNRVMEPARTNHLYGQSRAVA